MENVIKNEIISVITSNVCAQVRVEDIESLEQNGRKVKIKTSKAVYTYYGKLEDLVPYLYDKSFYRPMKSVIINFEKIVMIGDFEIEFTSGNTYTMGRNNFIKTRKAFKNYLMKYPPYSTG
jgi:DNA-binding LytR/AlgR family response regulator